MSSVCLLPLVNILYLEYLTIYTSSAVTRYTSSVLRYTPLVFLCEIHLLCFYVIYTSSVVTRYTSSVFMRFPSFPWEIAMDDTKYFERTLILDPWAGKFYPFFNSSILDSQLNYKTRNAVFVSVRWEKDCLIR